MRTIVPFICLTFLTVQALAWTPGVPHVKPQMRTAAYWIARHPVPDRVAMSPSRIREFNAATQAEGLTDDMADFPADYPGDRLRTLMRDMLDGLMRQRLFNAQGLVADESFYAPLKQNMALAGVGKNPKARRAVTVAFTSQRLVPTDEPLYETPGDVDFDQVQNSGLDPSTQVVVLHQSADGAWFFVKDGIASGWVHAQDVVFIDDTMWKLFWQGTRFAIVTAARTSIYLDGAMHKEAGVARMGARFIMTKFGQDVVEVLLPQRADDGSLMWVTGFVKGWDVQRGYLPYTARSIYTQAFKLLDAPYGWGDMGQQQDCSRFIQMVFATVGLQLPRNSGEQALLGFEVPLAKAAGGLTLLRLKGHIMLNLGKVGKRRYAIHAASSYREKTAEGEVIRPLKRVVVSDLSLGEGTSKGAFWQRIIAVRSLWLR